MNNPEFNEIVLQKFWLMQFLQGQILLTCKNKKLRIFSPGWWNYEQGPDFKNCEIELDGELLSGDAEIHIASSDWFKHGHHEDINYNNVVLHIIWNKDNKETSINTSSAKLIDELLLSRYIPVSILQTIAKDTTIKERKLLCASYFNSLDNNRISQILQEAALARLKNKSSRILKKISTTPLSQLLYENIMRACGYKHTKFLLEEFAEVLPAELLKKFAARYSPNGLLYVQAALYGCSKLLPLKEKTSFYADSETKNYLTSLWTAFEILQASFSIRTLTRLPATPAYSRPVNSPIRRLTAISHIIINSLPADLWDLIVLSINHFLPRFSSSPNKNTLRKMLAIWTKPFTTLTDPYWDSRFYFASCRFKKNQKLIGKERAHAIILNAFIPLLYAYSEYTGNIKLNEFVLHLYHRFPSLKEDAITRLMGKRLALPAEFLNKLSIYQQGLHGIFELFCNNPMGSCRNCPLTLCFS
ncbi:MAG: hypothetical protein A2Y62_20685 [Candidatus Fischerbacteria bacterium RBG_13_37_8]|uniref:DUF2851 domain-containing protein n=1 Tax=Candidatus Fischerbacteria bacterium RBG_13_37_8 TaxID=1817863 RepID=A0A1F5VEH9_9BACT|nr:MAG: hypothetical protein A2Y62_20685 [Candidatus Fischerbacteria bacterium RBG_13_37_8]